MADGNQPSLMVRKFIAASKNPPKLTEKRRAFRKQFYFFYGTLMDPATLARVLQRDRAPDVRPATTVGPRLKLWGEYPARPKGSGNEVIRGVACMIESQEEADRLAAYETEMYAVKGCPIYFDDGEDSGGLTFYWVGDESLLREGTFDLKDWLLRG
ncbi:hypothetical protein ASPZODRAFT_137202 [Penicilliopsis zonata CBS 506.65]|uniref:Putative gamma-glutamylcyclotransferase n=1 Tax=Penicilliopsis zonata CBS 506.65 TaxID=1073090 RepID=A0A1L9S600_9EURO|nr:hypothetical protein ASPZODRAFT_137202 [Penicilliopsis zonata CBS 506.65]OJJ42587.1 hypothetical protein ASPZODRAFT_137202 [Penicilliopsis zonata CBS 506.65]